MNDSHKWFQEYEKNGYPTTRAQDKIDNFDDMLKIIDQAFKALNKNQGLNLTYTYKAEKKATRKDGRKIILYIKYPKDTVDIELYESNFRRYISFPFGDVYFSNLNPRVQTLSLEDVLVLKIAA